MRRLLVLLPLLVAASACAQEAVPKPSASGDTSAGDGAASGARLRRADSVVARPAPAPRVTTDTLALRIGETPVQVLVHTAPAPDGRPGVLDALSVHDDENTAIEAALDVIARRGGRVVELRHTGARNVVFEAGGARYTADPNRMFTDAGRRRTLAALSRDTPAARAALAAFADTLLAVYAATAPAVAIALHNNTDGAYSAASYAPGASLAAEAARVHLVPGGDPDDFFFVTTEALYEALLGAGVAVVLQDNDAATDDGSLSVWAARRGLPYVNAEAQHGHRAVQARMLESLADALGMAPAER